MIILIGLIGLFLYLSAMVALVQFKQDTSIGNFTWGGGVMLVTLYTFITMSNFALRQIIITAMIICWAGRLIIHVYARYTGKDPRFAQWKWSGFKALIINIGWIFGQALMIAIMSYPSFLINTQVNSGLMILDYVGIIIWIIGYICEAVADHELFEFTHNPANKGKVMKYGIWHYSRHPNYFGEVVMWWGIYLLAIAMPNGWSALITPATITFLLLFVTGIPWIESTMKDNPEYQEYKRTTSVFIPWFPKK